MGYLRQKKFVNREEPVVRSQTGFLERWFKISRLAYPVPPHARTLPYTLGGITFIGFLLLFMSGLLLGQFFNPDPENSYESIRYLLAEVPGGTFLRAFHYWTAQAVIFVLLLHLLRVFVTGAYKAPRLFTWYFGVALLATALLGSYFSGTVLKWDQESFEALAHYREGLRILGPIGAWMGSAEAIALNIKLYLSHVSLFPLLLIALIAGHFYLINVFNLSPLAFGEDSARAQLPSERMTGKFLEHSKSILIYSIVYYGVVAIIAFILPAPLGPPNSGEEVGSLPPWPFLWLYGIENLNGRSSTLIYATGALFLLLLLVPLLDRGPERNPRSRVGTMAAGAITLLLIISFSIYAIVAPPKVHQHGGDEAPHSDAKAHEDSLDNK